MSETTAREKRYYCTCEKTDLPAGVMCRCLHVKEITSDDTTLKIDWPAPHPEAGGSEWIDKLRLAIGHNDNKYPAVYAKGETGDLHWWLVDTHKASIKVYNEIVSPLQSEVDRLREELYNANEQIEIMKYNLKG